MRILIPVDGSASSKAALRFIASRLAPARPRPRIDLLNVQPPIPAYAARFAGASAVRSYHAAESDKVLAPAAAELKKAGFDAQTRFAVGNAGATVSAAAKSADLVVMGARGHTATTGLLLGSVTNTVLATSSTPLLIVRAGAARKTRAAAPRIGIAIDGSRYGVAAVRYVLKHRELFGRVPALTLIHVVPDLLAAYLPGLAQMPVPMFSPEQAASSQSASFEAAMKPVRTLMKRARQVAGEVRLVGNSAGDEIAAYATDNKLDLLVMGSHGYGAFKAVVMGSVATRVAAKCNTPLLLIRAPVR
jgi:nucleotide-binding universal stress UspA family protein